MNYQYFFTDKRGNQLGFTQVYDKCLLNQLNDKYVRQTALFQFCNKYKLDSDNVEIRLESITRSKDACKVLKFEFTKVGK